MGGKAIEGATPVPRNQIEAVADKAFSALRSVLPEFADRFDFCAYEHIVGSAYWKMLNAANSKNTDGAGDVDMIVVATEQEARDMVDQMVAASVPHRSFIANGFVCVPVWHRGSVHQVDINFVEDAAWSEFAITQWDHADESGLKAAHRNEFFYVAASALVPGIRDARLFYDTHRGLLIGAYLNPHTSAGQYFRDEDARRKAKKRDAQIVKTYSLSPQYLMNLLFSCTVDPADVATPTGLAKVVRSGVLRPEVDKRYILSKMDENLGKKGLAQYGGMFW